MKSPTNELLSFTKIGLLAVIAILGVGIGVSQEVKPRRVAGSTKRPAADHWSFSPWRRASSSAQAP